MAHYALLDENFVVVQVIPGKDEGTEGVDWETWYGEFTGYACKRTSYNTRGNEHLLGGTPFRKNYAGIGYTYDPALDGFIPPKPYPSWVLKTETYLWEAPVPPPDQESPWRWDEDTLSWVPADV